MEHETSGYDTEIFGSAGHGYKKSLGESERRQVILKLKPHMFFKTTAEEGILDPWRVCWCPREASSHATAQQSRPLITCRRCGLARRVAEVGSWVLFMSIRSADREVPTRFMSFPSKYSDSWGITVAPSLQTCSLRLPDEPYHGNMLLSCGPDKLEPQQQLSEFDADFAAWAAVFRVIQR